MKLVSYNRQNKLFKNLKERIRMKCFTITAKQIIYKQIGVNSLISKKEGKILCIMAGKEKAEILPVVLTSQLTSVWSVDNKVYISRLETNGQEASASTNTIATTTKEAIIFLESHQAFHVFNHKNCKIILSGIIEKNGKEFQEKLIKIKKDQHFILQPEVGESKTYCFNGRDLVEL
jgi:hypothetical protein